MYSLPTVTTRRRAQAAPPRPLPAPTWVPAARFAEPRLGDLDACVRAQARAVADGVLAPRYAGFFWRSTRGPSQGVVLLLHGYTGGPWQFASLAQRLNTAGLDVFCMPLAGHGAQVDELLSPTALPGAGESQRYFEGAEAMYQQAHAYAQAHRLPLHVYGLSMGGALAIQVARDHGQDIQRLMLVAPLLRPARRADRWVQSAVHWLGVTLWGGSLLNARRMGWGKEAPAPRWPGHWDFSAGNLLSAGDVGRRVLYDHRPIDVPTQVVVSATDDTCDAHITEAFLSRYTRQHGLMTFGPNAHVRHAMVSAIENIDRGSRDVVDACTTEFLAQGTFDNQTHDDPPSRLDRQGLPGRCLPPAQA